MYNFEIKPKLEKKLFKIRRSDKKTFDRIRNKINEITLKVPMQNTRRVHIGSYVLTFGINEKENLAEFPDYDHHDQVYGK
jgi:mRNA-degrading endonuclease RelE of RelBE toxin-antitoxin system